MTGGIATSTDAGQLRIAVENADLEPGPAGAKMVYKALEDVVTTCNACHAAYRLR
ncbi:MAG: hypothetical protein HY985_18335 [Magnetospirillum sp.]|nr:hypothetical protein [Magnetospirillum sp.]